MAVSNFQLCRFTPFNWLTWDISRVFSREIKNNIYDALIDVKKNVVFKVDGDENVDEDNDELGDVDIELLENAIGKYVFTAPFEDSFEPHGALQPKQIFL